MESWVTDVTTGAMKRIAAHAELVGLTNTEEFTFRSMFMAEAATRYPGFQFQTEWHKFDLLVQNDTAATLIEFKYYLLRRTRRLDGSVGNFKGGAGPKNESEFWRCVEKIATAAPAEVQDRFLVLVYEREYKKRSRYSFHGSFGGIEPDGFVTRVWPTSIGPLEGRVLQIGAH